MSTTFLLIRHAMTDSVGRTLAGRMPGVHLNDAGQAQAQALAERLAVVPLSALYSSPLERARETAQPLADRQGLTIRVAEEIGELDYGDWTGRAFEELAGQVQWDHYNTFRSGTRIPNGELMLEAQARIVTFMERLRAEYPGGIVALISHSDLLKAALAYFLGAPLDLFGRIEIEPASVSGVEFNDWGPRILYINRIDHLSSGPPP